MSLTTSYLVVNDCDHDLVVYVGGINGMGIVNRDYLATRYETLVEANRIAKILRDRTGDDGWRVVPVEKK